MSVFGIGDIHGNFAALHDLLSQIIPHLSPEDIVVFLGDYIDRGPHVRECVDRIIEFRQQGVCKVVTLKGNHEDWMLKSYADHRAHSWIIGMEAFDTISSYSPEAANALSREIKRLGIRFVMDKPILPYNLFFDVLPPAHLDFFRNLDLYWVGDGVIFTHGGIGADTERLESQDPDTLIWGGHGFPESYHGAANIVYGHHRNAVLDAKGWPHPYIQGRTFGIDTIAEGILTAIAFPGPRIYQSQRHRLAH